VLEYIPGWKNILSVFLMIVCDDKEKHGVDINKSGIIYLLASIFSYIPNQIYFFNYYLVKYYFNVPIDC
jgi:hypothetical protein